MCITSKKHGSDVGVSRNCFGSKTPHLFRGMQEKVFYQLILFPGWLLLAMLHGAGRPGQALPWVVTVREQCGKYGLRIYFYFIDLRERHQFVVPLT